MNKLSFNFYRNILWLWDLLALNLVLLVVAYFIRLTDAFQLKEYQLFIAVFNLSWVVAVYLIALYFSKNWLDFETFFKGTVKSYILTIFFILFFIFLYHYQYSRLLILSCFLGFGVILLINRVIFNLLVLFLKSKFNLSKQVIVMGDNEISRKLVHYFNFEAKLSKVVGCFYGNDGIGKNPSDIPVINSLEECMDFARANKVTEIYSALSPEQYPYLYDLAKDAEEQFVHFKFVPDFRIFVNRNIFIDFVDDIPVLSLRKEPLEDTGNRIKKRLFDIAFSGFVILFVLTWLIPVMAVLIKFGSKGPVFFKQLRSGKNNQTFVCIKFRSLKINKEADSIQVTTNDSRVTPLGQFIRKTNIDELPQFINVFLGHMSVVGPRPHMLKHTKDFSKMYKEYMIRHFVKPGLTGWAQVHGFRGEISDSELLKKRIEHDIWYMENWSLWLDMKIIIRTAFLSVLGDKNAY